MRCNNRPDFSLHKTRISVLDLDKRTSTLLDESLDVTTATWPLGKAAEMKSHFWPAASILFGSLAVLKGFRVPGQWALSQLQISYRHGFVKRGLLGQLLYMAHIRSLRSVELFCFLELALLFGLLVLFTWQSGLLSEQRNPLLVAAFAGSYATTFLTHLVGYQDIALYALALIVILVRNVRHRFLLAIPCCIVGLLIHENFLLSAMPTILFSFFAESKQVVSGKASAYPGVLIVVGVFITVGVSLEASLSRHALEQFKHDTLAAAPYSVDPQILNVLGMSAVDNLKLNLQVISQGWWWWAEFGVAVMVLGPLTLLLFYSAGGLAQGKTRWAYLCASLSPLLLNVMGWDNVRWASLCSLSAYVNLGLLSRSAVVNTRQPAAMRERQGAILVLGLGLASGHGLMDSKKINPYPFFPPAIRPIVLRHDGSAGEIL